MCEPKPDVREGDVIEVTVGSCDCVVKLLIRITGVFISNARREWAYTGYYLGTDPQAPTCGYFADLPWQLLRRGGVSVRVA